MSVIESPEVQTQEPMVAPDPVFLHAAWILRRDGWTKGPWFEGGPRCVAGAIYDHVQIDRFAQRMGFDNASQLHDWNDAPERTKEEVIEALERAAYGV